MFNIFKKFKVFVEKQIGYCIKMMRSDRGKKYTSKEFDLFCEPKGIKRKLIGGYTS